MRASPWTRPRGGKPGHQLVEAEVIDLSLTTRGGRWQVKCRARARPLHFDPGGTWDAMEAARLALTAHGLPGSEVDPTAYLTDYTMHADFGGWPLTTENASCLPSHPWQHHTYPMVTQGYAHLAPDAAHNAIMHLDKALARARKPGENTADSMRVAPARPTGSD